MLSLDSSLNPDFETSILARVAAWSSGSGRREPANPYLLVVGGAPSELITVQSDRTNQLSARSRRPADEIAWKLTAREGLRINREFAEQRGRDWPQQLTAAFLATGLLINSPIFVTPAAQISEFLDQMRPQPPPPPVSVESSWGPGTPHGEERGLTRMTMRKLNKLRRRELGESPFSRGEIRTKPLDTRSYSGRLQRHLNLK